MKNNKRVNLAILFDLYGNILTEKQKEFFDLYYNNDLSLGEISENEGITRQGVRDSIQRAETVLLDMEEKLGLSARLSDIEKRMQNIRTAADQIAEMNSRGYGNAAIREKALEIISLSNIDD